LQRFKGPAISRHDASVLASLALLDTDDHALAVDRAWLQTHRLRDAQPGGVADGEDDALLEAFNRVEEVGDFGRAHHGRKMLRPATAERQDVVEVPVALERGFVEEPQRRDGGADRAGR
jgi:hypothetical protein